MFDPTKPVQTRSGRKARVICTDRVSLSGRTIIALVQGFFHSGNTAENFISRRPDGRQFEGREGPEDLVNTPVREEFFYCMKPTFEGERFTNYGPYGGASKGFQETIKSNSIYNTGDSTKLMGDIIKLVYEDGRLISTEIAMHRDV